MVGSQRLLREPCNLLGAPGSSWRELGQRSTWLRCAPQAPLPYLLPGGYTASSLACLTQAVPEAEPQSVGTIPEVIPGSRRKEWGV